MIVECCCSYITENAADLGHWCFTTHIVLNVPLLDYRILLYNYTSNVLSLVLADKAKMCISLTVHAKCGEITGLEIKLCRIMSFIKCYGVTVVFWLRIERFDMS